MLSRRSFLATAAAFASQELFAADYDLVVRGGRVIDPAQNIDRIADVAVRGGKISRIGDNLDAKLTVDATNKLVVPGLIDFHMHARDAELPASEILKTGVTTFLDGGSRGADNIDDLIAKARTANRMRIFINVGRLGNNPDGKGEFLDGLEQADVAKAIAGVKKHREWIIGIKARLSRDVAKERDMQVLLRAREVADATKLPIMIHIGDTYSPLTQLLPILKAGDIVTHPYAPVGGVLDEKGKLLNAAVNARKRGILFDFGNGRVAHWNWEVAESAIKQGFAPDTISTDLNLASRTDQVFDLPNVMSKFLAMGMPLKQVIAAATINAAKGIKELNALGTLRPGAIADITVLTLAQGSFDQYDNYNGLRKTTQKLSAAQVIAGGKLV